MYTRTRVLAVMPENDAVLTTSSRVRARHKDFQKPSLAMPYIAPVDTPGQSKIAPVA